MAGNEHPRASEAAVQHAPSFSARLADGTPILFRTIRPDDKDRLLTAFESLSPEARYARFLRPVTKLSAAQVVYLTEVDLENHFAWVALRADRPEQPGIGVGRWVRLHDEPNIAEVAITVVDAYQRRGLGHTLLWLCALSAVQRGVSGFRVWMLGENRAAMGLLSGLGGTRGRWEQGVYVATTPLPAGEEALFRAPPPLALDPVAPTPRNDR